MDHLRSTTIEFKKEQLNTEFWFKLDLKMAGMLIVLLKRTRELNK